MDPCHSSRYHVGQTSRSLFADRYVPQSVLYMNNRHMCRASIPQSTRLQVRPAVRPLHMGGKATLRGAGQAPRSLPDVERPAVRLLPHSLDTPQFV